MSELAVGIDFGTTNSAIAVADGEDVRLLPLPGQDGRVSQTWRTILYFEEAQDGSTDVSAGARAIARYNETEGQGRLVQSIKSHLASELFTATHVLGRRYTLETLVATFLRALRAAAPCELGRRAVVGRPVRYWGARTEEDDRRAIGRMRAALTLAGFEEVVFEHEPVAAAHRYASSLDHQELVLIADFGGGTSDFSLTRVGPGAPPAVLATSGVAIAGDSFDARLIDHVVAPPLGRDSHYLAEFGRRMVVPPWLYTNLRRWHHLSFLRTPKTAALLEKILQGAEEPDRIARLCRVIDDELGLPLHHAVEATKRALSGAEHARFDFDRPGVAVEASVARAGFDAWIAEELAAIEQAIDEVLGRVGVGAQEVDRVFATGGSSLVPAVGALLARRFGDRVVGGEELTSVAWGLAARAARV